MARTPRYDADPALVDEPFGIEVVEGHLRSEGQQLVGDARAVVHFLRRFSATLRDAASQMHTLELDVRRKRLSEVRDAAGPATPADYFEAARSLTPEQLHALFERSLRDRIEGIERAVAETNALRARLQPQIRVARESVAAALEHPDVPAPARERLARAQARLPLAPTGAPLEIADPVPPLPGQPPVVQPPVGESTPVSPPAATPPLSALLDDLFAPDPPSPPTPGPPGAVSPSGEPESARPGLPSGPAGAVGRPRPAPERSPAERPARPERPATERPPRPERPERPAPERPVRPERPAAERPERPERPQRPQAERPVRPERPRVPPPPARPPGTETPARPPEPARDDVEDELPDLPDLPDFPAGLEDLFAPQPPAPQPPASLGDLF